MKKTAMAWRLLKSKLGGGQVPFHVTFEITDSCNLSCEYCLLKHEESRRTMFDTARALKLVDEMAELGTVKINLTGGEPLLHPAIDELVTKIRGYGIDCFLNTNGRLIERHMKTIEKVSAMNVSLDGDEASHDAARGKGSQAYAVNALRIAKEKGIPRLMTAVIGKHNSDQLDYLVGLAREVQAGIVILYLIQPRGTGGSIYALPEEEGRKLFVDIAARKKRGEPFVYSAQAMKVVSNWPLHLAQDHVMKYEKSLLKEKPVRCYAGTYYCAVYADGTVSPCCISKGFVQGEPNVYQMSFREALSKIKHHGCYACNVPSVADMNMMFALHPYVIMNALAVYRY
jgi:MoaA/NifB/PqqE/SkfB family radical SAM enzyme